VLQVDDNDATHVFSLTGGNLAISAGTAPTFTFTNGKIDLNGSSLTLGLNASSAALAGAMTTGAASYMYNGQFKRWINAAIGNRDFPVGVSAFKRNASIDFTAAPATGGTLTAEWIPVYGGTNGLPLLEGVIVVNKTSPAGYWSMVAGDGLSGGTYTGTFTATGIPYISDYSTLVLLKRADNVSPWALDGTHVTTTGSNTAPVLRRLAMTGFSEFGIGANSGLNPLPITINYFTGTKQSGHHLLNWKVTCNSTPRATMILERSADSRNFNTITTVVADAARCNQPFDYTDVQPLAGMNYYRLKMVDVDGKVSYSGIVALLNATKGFDIISIAPNPVVTGNFKLNVTSAQASKMDITIIDMQGRTVSRQAVSLIAGFNSLTMNVGSLAAGTYTIQGNVDEDKSRVIRFVKQ
jgi:hypothetical protein